MLSIDPPMPPVPPASNRPLTRQDLIALGQARRPRQFLPLGHQALAQHPEDAAMRCLIAMNCGLLGLRTLGLAMLETLPTTARGAQDIVQLQGALHALPDDHIPVSTRTQIARANLDVLASRGLDPTRAIRDAWDAWVIGQERARWYRTNDAQYVRVLEDRSAGAWASDLTDHRSIARQFCRENLRPDDVFPPPVAIEGIDPPWLFREIWAHLSPNRVGYAPLLTIVQADAAEFLDGLAGTDLRDALGEDRVLAFVGPDASDRWQAHALDRLDEQTLGLAIATPGARAKISPDASVVVNRWSAAHAKALRQVQADVDRMYAGRDRAWWADRFAEARAGGAPVRVLLPTSRFSTFVRHSAEDLAEAFNKLGCDARVPVEPGEHIKPTNLHHLEGARAFEPDLVVLINYFRGDAGLPFPSDIPWATWIQDSMDHQLNARRFGPLDFVVGHLDRELTGREGFPLERTRSFPVVASTRKFHDGPVDQALADRVSCEVAYVSHQSETPDAFHARCVKEEGNDTVTRVLEALWPMVAEEAAQPLGKSLHVRLRERSAEAIARCTDHDEVRARYLYRQYAVPMADRMLRQEMLGWAKEICERRGWRLRVFGRGWEDHPVFASLASGELAHGEALRASYRGAKVHIHASVSTLVHQRVMECALSGGLPIGRVTSDIAQQVLSAAKREAVRTCEPFESDDTSLWYRVSDCPALAEGRKLREWMGFHNGDVQEILQTQAAVARMSNHPRNGVLHAAWLLGDLTETCVRNASDLERVLTRAIEDPAWRSTRSAEIADRVRAHCSTDVLAQRMLELVSGSVDEVPRPTETLEVPAA